MTKPIIYVFAGYSGAGKDTCAFLLPNTRNVKFNAPGKRALEQIYGLQRGYLDDRGLRQNIAPHSGGKTYLQVLIDFCEHKDLLVGPKLFPAQVAVTIKETLENGQDVAVTDMRCREELYALRDFMDYGYMLLPFWVKGGEKLASDKIQDDLMYTLLKHTEAKLSYIPEHQNNPDHSVFRREALAVIHATEKAYRPR
jgi:hypothetical protein